MTHYDLRASLSWALSGPEGATARVVLAWTLSGGAVGGGLAAVVLELVGRSTPGLLILVGPALFLLGTLAGLVFGSVLGVAGRPEGAPRSAALRRVGVGFGLALLLQPLSWLTSASIAVGSALRVGFRADWFLVGLAGWLIGAAACLWALREARTPTRRVLTRVGRVLSGRDRAQPFASGPAPDPECDSPDVQRSTEAGLSPGFGMSGPAP